MLVFFFISHMCIYLPFQIKTSELHRTHVAKENKNVIFFNLFEFM